MDSATQILDIAERRMRQSGYNAVSYRDIAAEMGIKSASLHYHFPKKVDLGTALVRRYSKTLGAALEDATKDLSDPQAKLREFVGLYRYAMDTQRLVCLCAVLGAEAPGLPDPVTVEIKTFFETNIAWLTKTYAALGIEAPSKRAKTALSALGGAMIISSTTGDPGIFEAATESVLKI